MAQAAISLDLKFTTFKRKAIALGCYIPNQGGKDTNKIYNGYTISLADILNGEHPQYQANKLRKRLIVEGYKENKCENCDLNEWCAQPIPLQLHHLDGNKHNHLLDNLQILCANCHGQTENFCGKNIGSYK